MTVDVDATGYAIAFQTEVTGVSSQPVDYGQPNRGLWPVPADVHSFTIAIVGSTLDVLGPRGPRSTLCGVWYDVPCTPGDVWSLEVGDPNDFLSGTGILGSTRNTSNGGDGFGISFPDGWGYAGASATIVSLDGDLWWCVGGAGGDIYPGTFTGPGAHAVPGPITYGPPTTFAGATDGADGGGSLGGGGGAGWPGGAAGATPSDAGESGGNYLPDVSGASLGGPPSPRWSDAFGTDFDPDTFAPADTPSPSGRIFLVYYRPVPGWSLDEITH